MVEVTEMKRKVYQTKDGYRVRYAMRLKNVLDGGEARPLKSAYIMMTLIEMIEKIISSEDNYLSIGIR